MMSMQTRMILGYGPYQHANLTTEDQAEAIRRLREHFIFVGDTDQWDVSIRLFHATIGGEMKGFELKNMQPGVAQGDQEGKEEVDYLRKVLVQSNWSDPYDEAIYAEVQRLMRARLASSSIDAGSEL
eukprot:CAMPEP_0179110940 /NCGR_PEP_ID=MMETSP0796-20121207/51798_1 /TAXON_ID=73915 /ORGANISM="Pyrodinium bahamense, Strain pbaha01" /LENGTH=126 /DNA_ID=CAMNT_0020809085 /DNA_START=13 /DNA_END=393 /DNA_ORIENTATION=-